MVQLIQDLFLCFKEKMEISFPPFEQKINYLGKNSLVAVENFTAKWSLILVPEHNFHSNNLQSIKIENKKEGDDVEGVKFLDSFLWEKHFHR